MLWEQSPRVCICFLFLLAGLCWCFPGFSTAGCRDLCTEAKCLCCGEAKWLSQWLLHEAFQLLRSTCTCLAWFYSCWNLLWNCLKLERILIARTKSCSFIILNSGCTSVPVLLLFLLSQYFFLTSLFRGWFSAFLSCIVYIKTWYRLTITTLVIVSSVIVELVSLTVWNCRQMTGPVHVSLFRTRPFI